MAVPLLAWSGALPVLWAFSVPGLAVPWLLAGIALWMVPTLVWLLRLAARVATKRGWSWWFAAAPMMIVVIGSYTITGMWRAPTGVIFTEANGAGFNSAGFAHLPGGPTPDLEDGSFEDPQWTSLGGHWYSWTAGW